jgi:hypothetical protein
MRLRRMKHLYFIRCGNHYFEGDFLDGGSTVIVLGDIAGYKYFIASLKKAETSKANVSLDEIRRGPPRMPVVILPCSPLPRHAPRVRFVQRLIYPSGKPEIELVIFGNRPGYRLVAETFQYAIDHNAENWDAHEHLDEDLCAFVEKRSVKLNIRGPFRRWTKKNTHANLASVKSPAFLPAEIDPSPRARWYEELSEADKVQPGLCLCSHHWWSGRSKKSWLER